MRLQNILSRLHAFKTKAFLLSALTLAGHLSYSQDSETEPNNTCQQALNVKNFIDDGYAEYTGRIDNADTDVDVWLVPITKNGGKIKWSYWTKPTDPNAIQGNEYNGPGKFKIEFLGGKRSNELVDIVCMPSIKTDSIDVFTQGTASYYPDGAYEIPPYFLIWTPEQDVLFIRITVSKGLAPIPWGPFDYTMKFEDKGEGNEPLNGTLPEFSARQPIVGGANLWLDASKATKNGNALTNLVDGTLNNSFTISGTPQVRNDAINFKPAIEFNGTGDYLRGSDSITFQTLYAVIKRDNTAFTTVMSAVNKTGVTQQNNGFIMKGDRMATGNNAGGSDQLFMQSMGSLGDDRARLGTVEIVPGQFATFSNTFIDGKAYPTQKLSTQNGTQMRAFSDIPFIGRSQDNANPDFFDGQIAELLMYPTSHSDEERAKLLTWLALKYGITLDPSVGRYVSKDGRTLWNNTEYWNDVFGIVKNEELVSTKANSINTVDASGGGIPGAGNLILESKNGFYLSPFIVGHNGAPLEFTDYYTNEVLKDFILLQRKWKVQHDQNALRNLINLSFDLTGLNISDNSINNFRLIIDTDRDGDFNSGIILPKKATSVNTANNKTIVNFNDVEWSGDGAVFTMATLLKPEFGKSIPNRKIVNPSFETGSGIGNKFVNSQTAGRAAEIDGWFSTHPNHIDRGDKLYLAPIEMAEDITTPQEGKRLVELNAWEPSRLYQTVLLVNGENINWRYYHRKRADAGNPNPDKVEFNLYYLEGKKAMVIDEYENSDPTAWTERSGTLNFKLKTGIYQIGFEGIDNGNADPTIGNLLDNITIGMKAFVEFNADTVRLKEGGKISPYFLVNGEVLQPSTFTVSVKAIDAVEGRDYSLGSVTKSIAVGNYALSDSIPINFEILDNDVPENDRMVVMTLTGTTGDVNRKDANGDGIYQQTMVIVIKDDDPCKNPGTDNVFSVCAANAGNIDLASLLGGKQDAGGTWSDVDGTGVGLTDPSAVNLSGLPLGSYDFSYSFPSFGICPAEKATVTIEIREPFPIGQDATISICDSENVDLLSSLGGSPMAGGLWLPPGTASIDIRNPASVSFAGVPAGSYEFIYIKDGEINCSGKPAAAILTVNVSRAVNAGLDNTVNECSDSPLNLFTSLGGSPDAGGSWKEITSSGADITNPANVDFSAIAAGSYKFEYTVTAVSPCLNDVSTLTVNVDVFHDAGTNNTVAVCNDGTTLNLFTSLGGTPDPGGSWTDTDASGADISNPAKVPFVGLAAGDYDFTYTIAGSGGCTDQSAVLTVSVVKSAHAGTNSVFGICTGALSKVVDFTTALQGTPDVGGTWTETGTVKSNVDISDPSNVDFTSTQGGTYTFTYTVSGTSPCADASADLVVKINQDLNPGSNTLLQVCNEPGNIFNLLQELKGSPDAGGNWAETSSISSGVDLSDPAQVDFSSTVPGSYEFTYTLTGSGSCPSKSSILYVTVNKAFDAGTDANLDVCNGDDSAISLLNLLGGTPDKGGTWYEARNPGALLSKGNATFYGISPGTYRFIYLLTDPNNVCAAKSSSVLITVNQEVTAGTGGNVIACDDNDSDIDLFAAIDDNPDAGGTWIDNDAAGVDLSDPRSVDFSTISAGVYTFNYVVTGRGACGNDTSTVHVTIDQEPNAGTDTQKTLCGFDANGSTVSLLALLDGSPVPGGVWAFTSTETFDISDPARVDLSSVSGDFSLTYTLDGPGACSDALSNLTLTVEQSLNAGVSGDKQQVCSNENAVIDLDLLFDGRDPGGSFADLDNSGVDLTDPGLVDFSGVAAGSYRFRYTLSNSCASFESTNEVVVSETGDAGDDATVTLCDDETSFNLFGVLGGSPVSGGYWSDDQHTGITLGAGASVDFSSLKPGSYTFTYHVENGICTPDVATVEVKIESKPFAGTNHTVLICDEGELIVNFTDAISINSSLTREWFDEDNSGVDLSDPESVDFTGIPDGRYRFRHTAPAQSVCGESSAELVVNVNENGNAGTDGNLTVCSGTRADLMAPLGTHDKGGTWSDDDGTGVDLFDPSNVDFNGVTAGTYHFTYTLSSTSGCSNSSSAVVTVVVQDIPDAGDANSINVCDGSSVDLFASLNGTPHPGGVWTEITNSGVDLSDPSNVDFTGVISGRYKFSYAHDAGACGTISEQLVVNVGQSSHPGVSASFDVCNTEIEYNLINKLGSPDPGGVWLDLDNSGVDLGNPASVSFAGVGGGKYRIRYKITSGNGCADASSELTVTVFRKPMAGTGGTTQYCAGTGELVNLPSLLSGISDGGGSWIDLDKTGLDLSDPKSVDISGLKDGEYQFNYRVQGLGACQSAVATVVLDITGLKTAGAPILNSVSVCNVSGSTYDLTSNLQAGYDEGGLWTMGGTVVDNPSSISLGALEASRYEVNYEFKATGSCPASSTRFYLDVQVGVNAGQPGTIIVCDDRTVPVDLYSGITGDYDAGGIWSESTMANVDLSNPSAVSFSGTDYGTYIFVYRVQDTGACAVDHDNIVTVQLVDVPDAGESAEIKLQPADDPVLNLLEALSGSPDAGGLWTSDIPDINISNPSAVDFSTASDGKYGFTYSFKDTLTCPGTSSRLIVDVRREMTSEKLKPSEGFSPNGDGINDEWYILHIEGYANNAVSIFNSSGALVFKMEGYNNTDRVFDGTANQPVVGSKELLSGTYYYLIEIPEGKKVTGYITLRK